MKIGIEVMKVSIEISEAYALKPATSCTRFDCPAEWLEDYCKRNSPRLRKEDNGFDGERNLIISFDTEFQFKIFLTKASKAFPFFEFI